MQRKLRIKNIAEWMGLRRVTTITAAKIAARAVTTKTIQ
jgi:hypothetical protein